MTSDVLRVFTVLLNFRHVDDTVRCVASLRHSLARAQNVVIVDNEATDTTAEALATQLPTIPVISVDENLGYAGGNNLGIRYALERDADFVWLLNPDTEVRPTTLSRLLECADAHPDAGILGSRILYGSSSTPTIWFNGGSLDRRTAATAHHDDGQKDADVPEGCPRDVDYVTGAGMLVKRDVFIDTGMLPEDYFLYYEETAFNLSAQESGWRTILDPRSKMIHHKRSTGILPAPYYVYYYVRNRLLFGARHCHGGPEIIEHEVRRWAHGWREKVAKRDPRWLPTFEWLVEQGIEDGHRGITGCREDIKDVPVDGGVGER